ncbi:hypothetical protein VNO78_30890 [Psophocarpus tetragonolobus]|uniref:EXPERA domain-containing protein n=1 Tax=Psophocarpus tetragonolobus TaxID=3891 RepID=A0AAN9RXH7_PSOTE
MAQTMLLMCSSSVPVGNISIDQKSHSLLQLQNQGLRVKISHLFFNPLSSLFSSSSSSSRTYTTFALFKPKTKSPPRKVVNSKPKAKVEDAIFGTARGYSFTKQNKLFVGLVAMLGFAASLLGEAELNLEKGISKYEAEPLHLFFIIFTLLGAIGAIGDRGKYVDDPLTGLDKAITSIGKGLRAGLGLKGPLTKTKIDTLLMSWWALTGLTHLVIEGYFVFSPELFKDDTGFWLAEVWKEFSKADSRYVGRDTGIVAIEGLTAVLEGPASLLAIYAIATKKSYSYILQFAISLGQLYGVAFCCITAMLEGHNLSANSFYYYAYYIGANVIWIIIPSIVAIRSWRKICDAFQVQGDQTKNS